MSLTYEDKVNAAPEGALVAELLLPGKESEVAVVPCCVVGEELDDVGFDADEGDDAFVACELGDGGGGGGNDGVSSGACNVISLPVKIMVSLEIPQRVLVSRQELVRSGDHSPCVKANKLHHPTINSFISPSLHVNAENTGLLTQRTEQRPPGYHPRK
jgi:hypothetical protein